MKRFRAAGMKKDGLFFQAFATNAEKIRAEMSPP